MSALVIDAEAVGDFLDKAEGFVTAEDIERWNRVMTVRLGDAADVLADDMRNLLVVPGTRRLNEGGYQLWTQHKETLKHGVIHTPGNMAAYLTSISAPPWLWEWTTFWLAALWPDDFVWWSRWMFLPSSRTGAVPLVLVDPECLVADPQTLYGQIVQAGHFMNHVMESLRRLPDIDPRYRHLTAFAMVYAVYLFTMTSWRLTEEFTRVLPPFPRVVASLLGIQRWEEYSIAKGKSN